MSEVKDETVEKATESPIDPAKNKDDKSKTTSAGKKQSVRKTSLKPDTMVPCISNINAPLIYNSPSTHRTFEWAYMGDLQHIELSEVQTMKGRSPRFFSEKWIIVDDNEIIDYLRIGHFYKNAIDEDDMESFFDMDVDEMERFLDKLSAFERSNMIDQVREKYSTGEFDSIRKIQFIEKKYNISIQE